MPMVQFPNLLQRKRLFKSKTQLQGSQSTWNSPNKHRRLYPNNPHLSDPHLNHPHNPKQHLSPQGTP